MAHRLPLHRCPHGDQDPLSLPSSLADGAIRALDKVGKVEVGSSVVFQVAASDEVAPWARQEALVRHKTSEDRLTQQTLLPN